MRGEGERVVGCYCANEVAGDLEIKGSVIAVGNLIQRNLREGRRRKVEKEMGVKENGNVSKGKMEGGGSGKRVEEGSAVILMLDCEKVAKERRRAESGWSLWEGVEKKGGGGKRNWRKREGVVEVEERGLNRFADLVEDREREGGKWQKDVVDFEEHCEDLKKDWLNNTI